MIERQLISLPSQFQLIERLQHIIYLSSSLVFVSGDKGAGKSALVEQLSNKLPDNIQQVFIKLNDQLSSAQIRQQIIMQLFDQPLFDAQDSLLSSMSLLQEKQYEEVPRLIILDNAHYLDSGLLNELMQLTTDKEQFSEGEVNILLLADEAQNQQMMSIAKQAADSRNRPCACIEFKLEPLTLDESKNLLAHVFKQSDYQAQIQHQDALLKHLEACNGTPKKIIQLAEEIIEGALESSSPSWLKTRLPAILLMVFLLSLAAGLGYYLYPKLLEQRAIEAAHEAVKNESFQPEEIDEIPLTTEAQPIEPQQPELEVLAGDWKNKGADEAITDNQLAVGVSDESVERVIISEQEILELSDKEEKTTVDEMADKKNVVKKKQPNEEIAKPVEENIQVVAEIAPQEAASEPVIENQAMVEQEGVIEVEVVALSELGTEASSPVENNKGSPFTPSSTLLAIKASRFTLQLSAMGTDKALKDFILEHGLPRKNVFLYETVRNNKPWYVVLFGEYQSRNEAIKASKRLPSSLANIESWVKQYQLVHQDLQLNNDEKE